MIKKRQRPAKNRALLRFYGAFFLKRIGFILIRS